jgi:chemotaxis protein MotB
MRGSSDRTHARARATAALLCLTLSAGGLGCVTAGTHDEVSTERDRLAVRVKKQDARLKALEASTTSLETELDAALEQYEDLSVQYDALLTETGSLRNTEAELESKLTSQSLELVASQQKLAVATSELDRLTATYTTLMSDLEAEVSSGQIQIEQLKEGIRVNVSDEILFASGSATLDPVGRGVLVRVIEQLSELDHDIEVQGHTDDRRIRGSLAKRYPTNWELAAARASRVVRLMQEKGIEGDRLKVVSFASFEPIASNDNAEDRALNRRIEIRLEPRVGSAAGRTGGQ